MKKKLYAYVGRIDDYDDIQACLDDLSVVIYRTEKEINDLQKKISNSRGASLKYLRIEEDTLECVSKIYLAFIVNPKADISEFLRSANTMIKTHERYKIAYSQDMMIQFGDDVLVDLRGHHQ